MRRKPMPACGAAVVGLLLQNVVKARLRLIEPVRIQRRKGRALGRRAGNAGVHLRQLRFIFLQMAGNFSVLRMRLEILRAALPPRTGLAASQISAWRSAAWAPESLGWSLRMRIPSARVLPS